MAKTKAKTKSKAPASAAPKFANIEELDGKEFHKMRNQAIAYYYQEKKKSEMLPDVWKWCKNNGYIKEQIDILKSQQSLVTSYQATLCKCVNLGMPDYNEQHAEYWEALPGVSGKMRPISDFLHKSFETIIAKGYAEGDEPEEEKAKAPVKTIQQRTYEAASFMAKDIDEQETLLLNDPENYDVKKFDAGSLLRQAEVKANHAKIIKEFYQSDLVEMREVLENNDEQLKEAYAHMGKKAVKNIIAFYEEIETACDMIAEHQKAQRKPRKAKVKPKTKVVEKLKYMKTYDPLKLVSVDPTKILDAKELWVYNTKTRKLGRYVVDDPYNTGATLSVKGTSIIGFDENKSIQKTLRKPEEKLKELKESGKVKLRKFMDEINAVDIKLNGRVNDQTILLKAL